MEEKDLTPIPQSEVEGWFQDPAKEKKTCMNCGDEITPENDGIEINGGEFYQCEDCHEIEFGSRIYAMNLYFANRPPDPMKKWIEELETNFQFNNHTQGDLIEYGHGGNETIIYQVPSEGILLNRIVTIDQMEALLSHMKKHQK